MIKHFHIPISTQLEDYATFIWEVKGESQITETILPQGVIEIVFNLGDAINGQVPKNRELTKAPVCFVQGINTHVVKAFYTGQQHLFGIRLHPHRVQALLGIPPGELNNLTVDLALIQPHFYGLWQHLIEVQSFEERVLVLQKELPILSADESQRMERLSNLFLSESIQGFQTVDELASQVCYSPRQLNRVAHTLFGLSAEELTAYKKFTQSVSLIHVGHYSLTEIAYGAGFYDQAHFCRSFKSYTGMTPSQYKKSISELPFHIFS